MQHRKPADAGPRARSRLPQRQSASAPCLVIGALYLGLALVRLLRVVKGEQPACGGAGWTEALEQAGCSGGRRRQERERPARRGAHPERPGTPPGTCWGPLVACRNPPACRTAAQAQLKEVELAARGRVWSDHRATEACARDAANLILPAALCRRCRHRLRFCKSNSALLNTCSHYAVSTRSAKPPVRGRHAGRHLRRRLRRRRRLPLQAAQGRVQACCLSSYAVDNACVGAVEQAQILRQVWEEVCERRAKWPLPQHRLALVPKCRPGSRFPQGSAHACTKATALRRQGASRSAAAPPQPPPW